MKTSIINGSEVSRLSVAIQKSTDEPSLADVDSVSAAETNFSEASGPDNGFFLSGNDFMRAEEESQRVVESFRDSLSRKKGF